MDPRGICREPLPFPSSFFIYFTLFFCSFFDCGTDFLIIRLRITRPVGEDDFFHSFILLFFILSHQTIRSLSHFFHSGGILSFFHRPSSLSSVSPHGTLGLRFYPLPSSPWHHVFASKRKPFSKEIQYTLGWICVYLLSMGIFYEGHLPSVLLSIPHFWIHTLEFSTTKQWDRNVQCLVLISRRIFMIYRLLNNY